MRQSASLVSGFRKCGLVPFNPEEVLSRLPNYQPPDVGSNVSIAVVNVLKEMRGVDKPRNPPQKRRRIAVAAPTVLPDLPECTKIQFNFSK